jgi:uncharacterized protein
MTTHDTYAQGTPCWADLQTTDQEGAKAFYGGLFGWSFDDQPTPQGLRTRWAGSTAGASP